MLWRKGVQEYKIYKAVFPITITEVYLTFLFLSVYIFASGSSCSCYFSIRIFKGSASEQRRECQPTMPHQNYFCRDNRICLLERKVLGKQHYSKIYTYAFVGKV